MDDENDRNLKRRNEESYKEEKERKTLKLYPSKVHTYEYECQYNWRLELNANWTFDLIDRSTGNSCSHVLFFLHTYIRCSNRSRFIPLCCLPSFPQVHQMCFEISISADFTKVFLSLLEVTSQGYKEAVLLTHSTFPSQEKGMFSYSSPLPEFQSIWKLMYQWWQQMNEIKVYDG